MRKVYHPYIQGVTDHSSYRNESSDVHVYCFNPEIFVALD